MELKDTVGMMNSSDYKERFKAEYHQLKIRLEKLTIMLQQLDKGELKFKPDSLLQYCLLNAHIWRHI